MDKFIPLEKKSKKEQKKYHAKQRSVWQMNPVTRTAPNGKGYDRNRIKREDKRNSRNFNHETPAVFVSIKGMLLHNVPLSIPNKCMHGMEMALLIAM